LRQPLAEAGDAASAVESKKIKTKGNLIVILSMDGLRRSDPAPFVKKVTNIYACWFRLSGTSAASSCFFWTERNQRRLSMWIKTSVAVLGIFGALAAATPAPTLAQGVYIGPGGVGVDVSRPGWRERHYRDDDGYYERGYRRHGCRTVTIR
jgi:hypothetical protein